MPSAGKGAKASRSLSSLVKAKSKDKQLKDKPSKDKPSKDKPSKDDDSREEDDEEESQHESSESESEVEGVKANLETNKVASTDKEPHLTDLDRSELEEKEREKASLSYSK